MNPIPYATSRLRPPPTTLFALLSIVALVAGAVIIHEAAELHPPFHAGMAIAGVYALGLMLASLAGVVLSVILPERLGKATLLVGSFGFFVGLAVTFVHGLHV